MPIGTRDDDPSIRAGALLRGLVLPSYRRLQSGEGALFAVNLSLLVAPEPRAKLSTLAGLSAVALALMYALNDLTDARRDLDNPRKDHALARDLSTYRASFAALLSAGHALAIAAAFAFAGARCGTATIAVFAVNALYSRFFKGIPILDVVVVGLWGAAYAAIVAPLPLVVPVGAMTAACHVFQATGDRDADLRAGVTTTAASPRLALLALAISSAALVFGLRALGWLALAGALPLVAGLVLRGSRSSWTASKIAFGAVWILLLWRLHGSH